MIRITFIEGLAIVCLLSGSVYMIEIITKMWWLWIPATVVTWMLGRKVGRHE